MHFFVTFFSCTHFGWDVSSDELFEGSSIYSNDKAENHERRGDGLWAMECQCRGGALNFVVDGEKDISIYSYICSGRMENAPSVVKMHRLVDV